MFLGLNGLLKQAAAVHRDLKPENILLDAKDRAFIVYVGASKVFGSLESAKAKRYINLLWKA